MSAHCLIEQVAGDRARIHTNQIKTIDICMSKPKPLSYEQWKTGRKFIFFNYEGQWFYEGYDCIRARKRAPNPIVKTSDTCTHIVQRGYIVHQFKFHVNSDINEKTKESHTHTHQTNVNTYKTQANVYQSICFLSPSLPNFFWLFLSVIYNSLCLDRLDILF